MFQTNRLVGNDARTTCRARMSSPHHCQRSLRNRLDDRAQRSGTFPSTSRHLSTICVFTVNLDELCAKPKKFRSGEISDDVFADM